MARAKPRVGITVGDPSGIGPEISLKAAAHAAVLEVCEPCLYGPHHEMDLRAFTPGHLSAEAGRAACEAIARAVEDVRLGRIDAIATAPINQEAFALAEIAYKGHTDLLAMLTKSGPAVMMFHSEPLRVILATVHVALREVPALLTPDLLDFVIDLSAQELPRFGYAQPKLALAGLNPHAGEHGVIGDEEELVLRPAVQRARQRGVDISGPWPGDTVFGRAAGGEFDAVIACYHDQGLIPVKLLAFGRAVNVTLGLPIIRTSVDHGTAFDIAGKGVADPSSLVEAIRLAARLAARSAEQAPP